MLHQHNVGTMTRRTPQQRLEPDGRLEIHPLDAEQLGVEVDDKLRVERRWGRIDAPLHITRRVTPGTLFLSFHQPESHTNRVVGPHLDPSSRCPQYKATAVRLRPA